jgi:hypothetical protein
MEATRVGDDDGDGDDDDDDDEIGKLTSMCVASRMSLYAFTKLNEASS